MNRIPVTGGAGPLGRYVVNQLVDDYEITALERPLEGYSTFSCRPPTPTAPCQP